MGSWDDAVSLMNLRSVFFLLWSFCDCDSLPDKTRQKKTALCLRCRGPVRYLAVSLPKKYLYLKSRFIKYWLSWFTAFPQAVACGKLAMFSLQFPDRFKSWSSLDTIDFSWNSRNKETGIKLLTQELGFKHTVMIPIAPPFPVQPTEPDPSLHWISEKGLKTTLRTPHFKLYSVMMGAKIKWNPTTALESWDI